MTKQEQRNFILKELEACDELEYNGYKILSCSYCVREFKRLVGMLDGTYRAFNNYQEALDKLVNNDEK